MVLSDDAKILNQIHDHSWLKAIHLVKCGVCTYACTYTLEAYFSKEVYEWGYECSIRVALASWLLY